jgi:hypothetical protein
MFIIFAKKKKKRIERADCIGMGRRYGANPLVAYVGAEARAVYLEFSFSNFLFSTYSLFNN